MIEQRDKPHRVLFTTFSGVPTSFSFFCPDPGLALLAAVCEKNSVSAKILVIFGSLLVLVSLVFLLPVAPFFKIPVISFLLNEYVAVALAGSRHLQLLAQEEVSLSKLVTWSVVVSCLCSIPGVYFFSSIGIKHGFAVGFFIIGLSAILIYFLFAGWLRFGLQKSLKAGSLPLLCFLLISPNLYAYTYSTAMSDRPRQFTTIAGEILTEDESFLKTNTMCALFKRDVNQGLIPELAQAWSIIKQDQIIEFQIKEGVLDGEGQEINAIYVKNSLEDQIRRTLAKTKNIRGYQFVKGFENCTKNKCALSGLTVPAKYILKIELTKPWPNLLGLLEGTFFVHQLKKGAGHEIPVSCGPYKIRSFEKTKMILEPNPFAFSPAQDGPSRVEILFQEPETAYYSFCTGRIQDLLFFMPSKMDLMRNGCKESHFQYKEVYSVGFWYVHLGAKAKGRLNGSINKMVQAFNLAEFRKAWGLDSAQQETLLPKEFGVFSEPLNKETGFSFLEPTLSRGHNVTKESSLVVRYIRGTPNAPGLEKALTHWLSATKVKFRIIPTAFSDFMSDFTAGVSDDYVFAEVANSENPVDFLSSFYQMAKKHASASFSKVLDGAWEKYSKTKSRQDLQDLEIKLRKSGLFHPLFSFRRPLVVSHDFTLGRYGDFGLFNLEISSIRRKHD